MKLRNFAQILAVSLALTGYSAWSLGVREERPFSPHSGPFLEGTDIPLLRLSQAEALWHESSTLFLDVRSAADYELGHITGALSMPEEEFEKLFPELKPRLERARDIVIYCKSVDCGKSYLSALRLRKEGLRQTKIYPAGWNEWVNRKLPTSGSGR